MAAQSRRWRNALILVSSVLSGAVAGVIGGLAANTGWKIPAAALGRKVGSESTFQKSGVRVDFSPDNRR